MRNLKRAAKRAGAPLIQSPQMWIEATRFALGVFGPTARRALGPGSSPEAGKKAADILKRGTCYPAGPRSWAGATIESTIGFAGDDMLAAAIVITV